MIATCPSPAQLQSLSLGKLSEEQSDALIFHLQQCESCQNRISVIDQAEDSLIEQLRPAGEQWNGSDLEELDGDNDGACDEESSCHVAASRALAALSMVQQDDPAMDMAGGFVPSTIGDYELVRPLNRGGMGNVYLGRHTQLGRLVAMKLIAEHRRWDQKIKERFAAEMQAIGSLQHPNVVAAYDAREIDGTAVLVTEFIDGLDVSELVRRVGPLSIADASAIVAAVCQALEYCHQQGLVHRDIKPSNVMIDRDGHVKVLDLGLARLQTEIGEFTATGQAIGTADYISPEQVAGQAVDGRSDLYSLGCMFFKLLTGDAPFASQSYPTTYAKMNAHVLASPPSLSGVRGGVPEEIRNLIEQLLEKEPSSRPQTATEVLDRCSPFAQEADLSNLVQRADCVVVAAGSTTGSQVSRRVVTPKDVSRGAGNWTRGFWLIAGLSLAFAVGCWLGVTLKVKKSDGSTASVVIPDGSTAVVDEQGNIEILLAGSDQSVRVPGKNVEVRRDRAAVDLPSPKQPAVRANWSSVMVTISEDSPLFGGIEVGDHVDLFGYQQSALNPDSDSWLDYQLICGCAEILSADEMQQGGDTQKNTTLKVPSKDRARTKAHFERDEKYWRYELRPCRPKNRTAELRQRKHGVWRMVWAQLDGELVDFNDWAVLGFRDEVAVFGSEGSVKALVEGPKLWTGTIDELEKGIFLTEGQGGKVHQQNISLSILESGRLEIVTKFGEGILKARLERVNAGAERSIAERKAFACLKRSESTRKKLEFYILSPETDAKIGTAIIDSSDILSANADQLDGQSWSLGVDVTEKAADRLRFVTRKKIGQPMGIFVDDELIAKPIIRAEISGQLQISGDFTKEQCEDLASQIVPKLDVDSFQPKKGASLKNE